MNCLKYICITVILSYSNVLFAGSEYLSSVEFMYNLSQEYNGELLDASLKGTHNGICDALKATNDKNTWCFCNTNPQQVALTIFKDYSQGLISKNEDFSKIYKKRVLDSCSGI